MSHAFVKNHIHLVFSTKDRQPSISKDVQSELWSYLAGICRNPENGRDCHQRHVGPRAYSFSPAANIALADAIRLLKTNSSKWMNEQGRRFAWQDGYGAFSVSVSNTAIVAKYIRDQEKHHRKMTFEQEYRALLKKHGINPDAP